MINSRAGANNLTKSQIITIVSLIALAILCEYLASGFSLISVHQNILDSATREIKTIESIEYPPLARAIQIAASFFWAIATSVIISLFIASKIETRYREETEAELQKIRMEINKDVFSSLFQRLVDPEIFHAIKSDVIDCKLLRRNTNWIFDFSQEENRIVQRITIKHSVENTSNEDVSDAIHVCWDREHKDDDEGLQKVIVKQSDKQEIPFDRNNADNNHQQHKIITDSEVRIEIPIVIPRRTHAEIIMVVKQYYEHGFVNDSFFTRFPIIDATLTANFPTNFLFSVMSSMSTDFKCTLDESTRKIYEAKGAILPRQGFSYCLMPKKCENHSDSC